MKIKAAEAGDPQNGWVKVPWDGNRELGFECWRKSFGRGHVSVGCGSFLSIVYSYGANSDDSMSGTRWNYDLPLLTEEEAMAEVDMQKGKYDYKEPHPTRYGYRVRHPARKVLA